MEILRALRHRPFAFLFSGQTLSRLGDSLYSIALAWWVLEKTGSATIMGSVMIVSLVPMLIFLLLGGVAVDRVSRLRVMLVSDLLRGALLLGITALVSTGRIELWHIYTASILFGVVDAFFQPAYTVIVPEITPAEALPSANSLTTLSGRLASVAGPAIGAAIVAAGGTALAFGIDALSFFISAGCLLVIWGAEPKRVAATAQRQNVLHDLREGVGLVHASPWLWITIAIAALANVTLSGPFSVALPFLVKKHLNAGVGTLGFLYSCNSAGAVAGALWLGRSSRLRRRGLNAYLAWIISGLALLALGLPLPLPALYLAAFVIGVTLSVFGLIWTNSLQELVPRQALGRVSSVDFLGSYGLLPVGYAVAGWATDRLGAPLVFLIGGAITSALAGLGLLHPGIRNLD